MRSNKEAKVYNSILECIGNTPLVRLNRIPKDHGLQCQMYAKCEFQNPGGSLKDRIGYNMVVQGEKSYVVKPGTRFIEPTSGNTGIGVALVSAIRGYDCTIVTPDKNSEEKMSTMRLLGSDVIETPSAATHDDPENYMQVTKRLLKEYPNGHCLDQYKNQENPRAHYEHTAEEIIEALGDIDMFVMGAGTGGTVTGVARRLKEHNPKCIIVAVDPKGSIIFGGKNPASYLIEGIGGDFIPEVLDKSVIDKVVQSDDYHSFNMSREIIRKEGLLCGGSSGSITYSAIQAAKELNLGPDKKVVVILPDGIRNYMTKFVCDQWMEAHLFKQPPERDFIWWKRSVTNLEVNSSVPKINQNQSCKKALNVMGAANDIAFVVNDDGFLLGVVSKDKLRSEASNPKKKVPLDFNEPVIRHIMTKFYKIAENSVNSTVGLASRILDITPFVVVVEEYHNGKSNLSGSIPKGIITSEILLDYIVDHQNKL